MNTKLDQHTQDREIIRCMSDPIYFYTNYMYLNHPIRGPIKFIPFPFQWAALNNYHDNQLNVTGGSRQTGITTMTAARILWLATMTSDANIILASNKKLSAIDLLYKVRYAFERLPTWLKPEVTTDTRSCMEFDTGTKIMACATTGTAAVGFTVSHIFWDQATYTPKRNQAEFWDNMRVHLAMGSTAVVSTSGVGPHANLFSELWDDACWTRNFIPWDMIPDRGDQFKREKIQLIGERAWQNEYVCDYGTSTWPETQN